MSSIIKKSDKQEITPFEFNPFEEEREEISDFVFSEISDEEVAEPQKPQPEPSPQLLEIADFISQKLAEAEEEAERIRKEAWEKGKEEGFKEGYKEGLEEASKIASEIKEVLEGLKKLPVQLLRDYQEWLVETAFSVAKHILQTEISINPQLLLSRMTHLINQMEEDLAITIYINPEDFSALRILTDLEELLKSKEGYIKFKEDPSLSRGSLKIENDISMLDATLENVLEELKREALMAMRGYGEYGSK